MDQNLLTLLAVVVAGVVTIAGTEGPFSPWETILGFILLLLLAGINPAGFPIFLRVAFLSIAGLSLIIMLGYPIERCVLSRWEYFDVPRRKKESEESEEQEESEESKESEARHLFFFVAWLVISFVALPFFYVAKKCLWH